MQTQKTAKTTKETQAEMKAAGSTQQEATSNLNRPPNATSQEAKGGTQDTTNNIQQTQPPGSKLAPKK